MKIQKYRFFDHYIELRSDHAETLTLMEAMFRRFALTEQDKKGDKLRYDVLTQIGGKSGIHTHDFCHIVDNTSLLPALAHGIILRHFLAHIRSHLLFHAAALSHGKKGVIIAADSGCGKTTLALALVRKGFKLLSDETAALNLSTGTLTPYPRCLWIRAGTRRVFQDFAWDFPTHDIAIKTQERTAIHLSSTLMGNTCQPFCLFMIQRPKQADERLC
ncbi:MAG: hypothetical protein KAH77_11335, partial [Thiomargarita sp.]|nr:hypothetical protein [Thiomargarita sp.]